VEGVERNLAVPPPSTTTSTKMGSLAFGRRPSTRPYARATSRRSSSSSRLVRAGPESIRPLQQRGASLNGQHRGGDGEYPCGDGHGRQQAARPRQSQEPSPVRCVGAGAAVGASFWPCVPRLPVKHGDSGPDTSTPTGQRSPLCRRKQTEAKPDQPLVVVVPY
jgi:hypothetical protein